MNQRTVERPMRAVSVTNEVYDILSEIRNEITRSRRSKDRYAREASFSEVVMKVLQEAGRVVIK